jgi:Fe-S cluster assembly protein SufD
MSLRVIKHLEEVRGAFEREKVHSLNKLIVPTWRWLKVNDFQVEGLCLPEFVSYNKNYLMLQENIKGTLIRPITEGNFEDKEVFEKLRLQGFEGVGEKFVTLGEVCYNAGLIAHIPRNTKIKDAIRLEYVIDNENHVVIDHNIIVAEENSEVTVVIDIASKEAQNAFHNGVTKIFVKRGAVVNLIKVQRLHNNAMHFDSNIAFVEGDGKVNYISVELGSKVGVSNYATYLDGVASEGNLGSIYFGDGDRKIDLSYTMTHRGMRSQSTIESRGALKDKCQKIFRGNLDFKKGARRSKGTEEEYVILFDKGVRSDAIPTLLCEEDDVEGQHAASAGQVDGDKLYYLMSRGLSEKEAKKLIVESSFRPIIDKIPFEDLRKTIDDEIHRRLVYA